MDVTGLMVVCPELSHPVTQNKNTKMISAEHVSATPLTKKKTPANLNPLNNVIPTL